LTLRLSVVLAWAPLALAVVLWAVALPAIDLDRMTDLGLISVLPATFYLALLALILGFCLTLAQSAGQGWAAPAYVATWIVIVHGTPTLIYGSLRYSWAWKHVGIVDYIQRKVGIDPAIANLAVYHNWPGFFGAAAMLTESTGLPDALSLATWAPVLFELLFAAGVLLVLRAATPDLRLAWLGVWFFVLTNWVGQDYFSPQAMAYVFYLVVVGICLWAFSTRMPLAATEIGRLLSRWRSLARLIAFLDCRISTAQYSGAALAATTAPQRRSLLALVIVLLAAIAVSHQLTPLITILALAALVISGQCAARGLPLLMFLFSTLWLVTGASHFAAFGIKTILDSLGHTEENFSANLIDPSLFGPGFRIVSNMARAVTAAVGLLALVGWLRRFRQGYLDLSLTLLAVVPLGGLAVSGYGGEILFRTYFFALPFLAFFVAALFAPKGNAAGTALSMVAAAIACVVLAIGFLFAYYGHEQSNYFRPDEVAAAEYLADTAPDGSLIIEASPNYPSRFRRYEEFVNVPLVAWARGTVEESTNAYSLDDIVEMMSDAKYPAAYLIMTRSQLLDLSQPGVASIERIQREIEASGKFKVIYHSDDATIYTLASQASEVGS
jgi:hypothetical protein